MIDDLLDGTSIDAISIKQGDEEDKQDDECVRIDFCSNQYQTDNYVTESNLLFLSQAV